MGTQCGASNLKWQCHKIFLADGLSGQSDKQVKMVYIENSFSWRNSNFFTSLSIEKLTKKVCGQCSNKLP